VTRRTEHWAAVGGAAKALRIDRPEAMERVVAALAATGIDAVAQEFVEGPESRIESYHAYIDEHGEVAGEFTGRKIRTRPPSYGHSTALETTSASDVARCGLEVLRRLGLRGVAKVDFKRTPQGDLRLLEVNPRFNLWHHLGAVAGVNLPALVYADLTGTPRPPTVPARPGLRWCAPADDLRAQRALGVSLPASLRSVLGCEARKIVALDDPMPFVRGRLAARLVRVLPAGRGAAVS